MKYLKNFGLTIRVLWYLFQAHRELKKCEKEMKRYHTYRKDLNR